MGNAGGTCIEFAIERFNTLNPELEKTTVIGLVAGECYLRSTTLEFSNNPWI